MHEKSRAGTMRALRFSLGGGMVLWMLLEGLYFFGVFSAMGGGLRMVLWFHFIAFSFGAALAAALRPIRFASALYLLFAIAACAAMDILHELYQSVFVDKAGVNALEFVRETMSYLYASMYVTAAMGAMLTVLLHRRLSARRGRRAKKK